MSVAVVVRVVMVVVIVVEEDERQGKGPRVNASVLPVLQVLFWPRLGFGLVQ